MPDTQLVKVTVRTPEGVVFEDAVRALSATNESGLFDIIYEHTNFVTVLTGDVLLHLQDGSEKNFAVQTGVLRAFNSEVDVLIGVATAEASVLAVE